MLPAPWREVTNSRMHEGRGSVLGGDTSRRARWWQLRLICGHVTERAVRYGPHRDGWPAQVGGTQHRSKDDVLPAPKRVRCKQCPVLPETPDGRIITARWFTDLLTHTGHPVTADGFAACTREIRMHHTAVSYWKDAMPAGITPCTRCENILAGQPRAGTS